MANYSIKDLEKLSGIKAHTLRIWEKRYAFLKPKRTKTNIRFYDDDQLKRILSISILNEQGMKISQIANMSKGQIEDTVKGIAGHSRSYKYYIDQLTIAMVDLDEFKFQEVLHEVTMKIGFEDLVTNVLYAFLDQIGVLWLTGSIIPAQEHFVTNLIRQKILVAIDGLPTHMDRKLPSMVMFLPEKEMHEIGLLFQYYLAKKQGFKVFYLGQIVPQEDALETLDQLMPSYVVISMTTPQFNDGGKMFFQQCHKRASVKKVICSGSGIGPEEAAKHGVHYVKTAAEFKDYLLSLKKTV